MIRISLHKTLAACLLAASGLASALVPAVGAADTPAIANRAASAPDASKFGPPQSILLWTPEQQRIGYPNMDRIFLTRTISRGDAKAHPAFPLPDEPRDLQKLTFTIDGATHTLADYLEHNRV